MRQLAFHKAACIPIVGVWFRVFPIDNTLW